MKTTILLALISLFFSSFLHAQIEKGRIQIGGSISGYYQKNKGNQSLYKDKNLSVSPSVSLFYKTNKLAGLFLNYNYAENINTPPNITHGYGGGLLFRQYQPVVNKLYLFFDERGGYNYTSGKDSLFAYHGYNISVSVQAGMAYDIAKKMQLELLLNNLFYAGYSNSNLATDFHAGTSLDNFFYNGFALGFRFYLR